MKRAELERNSGFQELTPEQQAASRVVLSIIMAGLSNPEIVQGFNLEEIRTITLYTAGLHFTGEIGKIATQELNPDELKSLAQTSSNQ